MAPAADRARFVYFRLILAIALVLTAMAAIAGLARAMHEAGVPFFLSLGAGLLLPAILWLSRRALGKIDRLPRRTAALAVFVFAFLLRALPPILVPNRPVSGLAINLELAKSLLAGTGISVTGPAGRRELEICVERTYADGQPTAFFPPGAALWGAMLGAKVRLFKVVNVLLGAGTCALIYLLAAEVDAGAACLASFLWAAYPASVFATNIYGIEPLFAFCIAGLAWLVSRLRAKDARISMLAAVGLDAAWCSLLHPPWFTLLAALGAVWLRVKPAREGLRRAAICAAFLFLGLSPWMARNWLLFHRVIPVSTDEGIALAGKTVIHAPPGTGGDAVWRSLRSQWQAGGEIEKSAAGYRVGLYYLAATVKAGPTYLLRAAADDLERAFGTDTDIMLLSTARGFSIGDVRFASISSVLSEEWQSRWLLLNHAYYVGLFLLACWGCRTKGGQRLLERDGPRFLAVNFLIMWALLAVLPGLDRYHFSLMLPVVLLAGQGAKALISG